MKIWTIRTLAMILALCLCLGGCAPAVQEGSDSTQSTAASSGSADSSTPSGDQSGSTDSSTPSGDQSGSTDSSTPSGDQNGSTDSSTPSGDQSGSTDSSTPSGGQSGSTDSSTPSQGGSTGNTGGTTGGNSGTTGGSTSGSNGPRKITFYWTRANTDYSKCDLWAWWDGKEGSGYKFETCDYGVKVTLEIPVGVSQVGFIVRLNCSEPGGSSWGKADKDYDGDLFALLTSDHTHIYLKSGDSDQYSSTDGGKTLTVIKNVTIAGMINYTQIQYNLTPKTKFTNISQFKLYDGDRLVPITKVTNLNIQSASGVITVGETLDITKNYRLEIEGFDPEPVVPTKIYDTTEFKTTYLYDGDDLGAIISGSSTTFKVWAPTASDVKLNLFKKGDGVEAYESLTMKKGDKGVWSLTVANCGHGTYYTYTVSTCMGVQEAVDPYAKAAGLNGDRGMVVNLDKTDPSGWSKTETVELDSYTEATIWEVHVRDFSNTITQSKYQGKYLAFTEHGLTNSSGISVGVDYLKNLGITHIHLLPVYDYATVDEADPDSQFNWGYDPKNYNVPEGSYSTDPTKGEVRITEFKQMVQSLHDDGFGVIMDVVYNHTYDSNGSLNRIVPYYYYRYTATGANSSASGCGNDTASERYMYRKFMVDSVSYWASEYKLDGFRFDLMGLHDLETMRLIEEAVHKINPDAIIYGEGWTMGYTSDGSAQANQTQISKITATNGAAGSIAVFNDAIRDGLKGGNDTTSKGYINGNTSVYAKVEFGIKGGTGSGTGWTVKNGAVINYTSSHDNLTLWDKLTLTNTSNTLEERLAMNRMAAAVTMISKGTPFWQAGEEMLRTKNGDENSYKSSDAVNNLKWETLTKSSNEYKMMLYYKGLIAMREEYDIFSANSGVEIQCYTDTSNGGLMTVKFTQHSTGKKAVVIINPNASNFTGYGLDAGSWKLVANGTQAGASVIRTDSDTITVPARSVLVYVN